ncbi:hypothetical protein L3V83_10740 [Thiotrichales bacterium 19X7-9]|nr:hypothetical protein [Thiotrichales bacterium 19X7-9]
MKEKQELINNRIILINAIRKDEINTAEFESLIDKYISSYIEWKNIDNSEYYRAFYEGRLTCRVFSEHSQNTQLNDFRYDTSKTGYYLRLNPNNYRRKKDLGLYPLSAVLLSPPKILKNLKYPPENFKSDLNKAIEQQKFNLNSKSDICLVSIPVEQDLQLISMLSEISKKPQCPEIVKSKIKEFKHSISWIELASHYDMNLSLQLNKNQKLKYLPRNKDTIKLFKKMALKYQSNKIYQAAEESNEVSIHYGKF